MTSDDTKDIVVTILRQLQGDMTILKRDMSSVKEHLGSMNIRLTAVESHMAGFMATSRFMEAEIDSLRGRVESLEEENPS